MKKILIVAAAAGLMTLAACDKKADTGNAVVDNAIESAEANAAAYENAADAATNDVVEGALENAATNEAAAADALAANATH